MRPPLLHFTIEGKKATNHVRFALQTLADAIGYASSFKPPLNGAATLSYGPNPPENLTNNLHIHQENLFWRGDVIPQFVKVGELLVPTFPGQKDTLYKNGELKYDLVFPFYFFLSGEVESKETEKDSHGLPLTSKCYLGRNRIHQVPLLNQYAQHLRYALQKLSPSISKPIPLWPQGKRYAIALSHDVDAVETPLRGSVKHHILQTLKKPSDVNRIAKRTIDLIFRSDYTNNIASVIEYERKCGFRSTFFFGSLFDNYTISDDKVAGAVKYVRDQGWELGLHPSYGAYSDSERLRHEKQSLEDCMDEKIKGIRHHYWRLDEHYAENTLLMHNKLGFQYDCSLAFNDDIGFRRGYALPYHPFHIVSGVLDLLEIPPTVMDGAVLYENVFQNADDAIEKVIRHLQEVKASEGLAVLSWHDYRWQDHWYPYWGAVYRRVVERLVEDSEAFVAPLGEIATYWLTRERQLRDFAP